MLRGTQFLLLANFDSSTMSSLIRERAFINGEWVPAASGKTFTVTNPFDGSAVANVPDMGKQDTEAAIDAAHKVREMRFVNQVFISQTSAIRSGICHLERDHGQRAVGVVAPLV